MFKRMSFSDYQKTIPPTPYNHYVPEGGSGYAYEGLIHMMRFGGCMSCIILSEGTQNLGAATHFRPVRVDEHIQEVRKLTSAYTELKEAQNVALVWDGTNRKSRTEPNGRVRRLLTGLEGIFSGREIDEIPYEGALDWCGLYVDEGLLILP